MRKALKDLIEAVEAAINAGDWKVDGACDPTLALIRAKDALAQRKPLTDEQIAEIGYKVYGMKSSTDRQYARAIEAAHGIKE